MHNDRTGVLLLQRMLKRDHSEAYRLRYDNSIATGPRKAVALLFGSHHESREQAWVFQG
jgi:hypothetical protein